MRRFNVLQVFNYDICENFVFSLMKSIPIRNINELHDILVYVQHKSFRRALLLLEAL